MDVHQVRKATRREWGALAVVALPCFMYSMDLTVLNLAVPSISTELRPSNTQLLWFLDIYGFFLAALLLPMGVLGDKIGRRCLLLIGAVVFGAASVLAAHVHSAAMLIVARALLGVGGATLAPSTLSLIRYMFCDSRQRNIAIGMWAASFSLGSTSGPLIGGMVIQSYGWRSVFFLCLPAMAALLLLGPKLLPEVRAAGTGKIDSASVLLAIVTILLGIYGLKQFAAFGWSWKCLASVVASIVSGIGFMRRQTEINPPFVDLRFFEDPLFRGAMLAYAVTSFVGAGISLFVSQYLQLVMGLSALQAGLWTMPTAIGLATGSLLSHRIFTRARLVVLLCTGFVITGVGLALIGTLDFASRNIHFLVGLFVCHFGLATVSARALGSIVGSVPSVRAGEVSALAEAGSELGAAMGLAALGSVGLFVYKSELAKALPDTLDVSVARVLYATLGDAITIAQNLPDSVGHPLLRNIRAAYDGGFKGAILFALLAIGATMVLLCIHGRAESGSLHDVRLDGISKKDA